MGQSLDTAYIVTNGTTWVDCKGAPAATSTNRAIYGVSVYNADSVARIYTLSFYDGSANRTMKVSASVAAGATVQMLDGMKPIGLYNTTSKKVQLKVDATATTTESDVVTTFADYA